MPTTPADPRRCGRGGGHRGRGTAAGGRRSTCRAATWPPPRLPRAALAGLPRLLRGHARARHGHVDAARGPALAGRGARRLGGGGRPRHGRLLPAHHLRRAARRRHGRPRGPAQRPRGRAARAPRCSRARWPCWSASTLQTAAHRGRGLVRARPRHRHRGARAAGLHDRARAGARRQQRGVPARHGLEHDTASWGPSWPGS